MEAEGYRSLEEGDRVEFVIEETSKGLQASHVKKI
ncbi:MAG TPA: cold shock domain-containing protein [Anaerolineae bacterium]